ncbi:MAG: DegT/DnrJ/EryC1/StrS family aminotransferase [Anaerolineaceae bacterium]|nr:DegT/DnrJ/EryC1/StrS family aminotransferase [Anaerolineaceae bacterium]
MVALSQEERIYAEQGRFAIPRSRNYLTHQALREEILAALEPMLFSANDSSYRARKDFEEAFAAEVEQTWAVGVHSGTCGLFLALRACGVGPGDEVITVANSDISTTAAISNCGATPVLCDLRASDYNMDPDLVEALISDRSRALLPVDMHGHPADVKRLREIADRHGLTIVEDACLATGARDYGRSVGVYADAVVFSFAPYKPFGGVGSGAAVATSEPRVHEKLRLLTAYGAGRSEGREEEIPGRQYAIDEGYNLSLDGLQAAVLRVKLPWLRQWTQQRREIVEWYREGLAGTTAVLPSFRPESEPTFRSFTIGVDNQQECYHGLRAAGVEAALHYTPPVHHYEVYRHGLPNAANLPVTERLADRLLTLPVTQEFTREDIDYVTRELRALLRQ